MHCQLRWAAPIQVLLQDCQSIIDYNISNPGAAAAYGSNNNQIGIARIHFLLFWQTTDRWGDIPAYSRPERRFHFTEIRPEEIYFDKDQRVEEAAAGFDIRRPSRVISTMIWTGGIRQ